MGACAVCDVQCALCRSRDHSCALPDAQIYTFCSFNLPFHIQLFTPASLHTYALSVNQSRFCFIHFYCESLFHF